MLNRRIAYGVSMALMVLGLSLTFCLRGVWPELAFGGVSLAFFAFIGMMFMLGSEGGCIPECRRQAIEAALPARPVGSVTLPCSLRYEQMAAGFSRHMKAFSSSADGTLDGAYEDDYRDWSGRLHPLVGKAWMLQLWANRTDYLRDRELAVICEEHELPIEPVLMGTHVDAFCVCKSGKVHIFPSDAREDVIFFLSLFDSCTGNDNVGSIH